LLELTKMYFKLLLCFILVILHIFATEQVQAGNIMIYPSPSCSRPYKPYQFNSEWELQSFKDDYERYIRCMQNYIDDAYDDIRQINNAIDDAVMQAKRDF